jgi:hypothetical protein
MDDNYNYANDLNINNILSSEALQSKDIPKIRVSSGKDLLIKRNLPRVTLILLKPEEVRL